MTRMNSVNIKLVEYLHCNTGASVLSALLREFQLLFQKIVFCYRLSKYRIDFEVQVAVGRVYPSGI